MNTTSFHDFRISGAGEFPCLRSTGCFRANRRSDGLPVLLHRYRPPDMLLSYEPKIYNASPPEFTVPFVTRFIAIIQAAGSAYLVEPLPLCIPLEDAWRCILVDSPDQAIGFVHALIMQINEALRHSTPHDWCLGTLCLDNIVLTPSGTCGLLAEQIECERVHLMLRTASSTRTPRKTTLPFSPVGLLRALLRIEERTAHILGQPVLAGKQRHALRKLAAEVQYPQAELRLGSLIRQAQITAIPM